MNISRNVEKNSPKKILTTWCRSFWYRAHFGTKFSSGSIWEHLISTLWNCLVRQKIGKLFEKFPDKKQNFLETISSGLQG